jgi:hypothetical protein
LQNIKDFGQLPAMAQYKNKAIFELSEDEIREIGTRDNLELSKTEFDSLSNNILKVIEQY